MSSTKRISQHDFISLPNFPNTFTFTFNGRTVHANEGDTVASALFSAGEQLISRSFKYHRRRGLKDNFGQGPETLVTIDHAPNLRADMIMAKKGMAVVSQNHMGSLENDFMSINNTVLRWLPYGFYYKMFHKPKWVWKLVEPMIRKAAGLGSIDTEGHHVDTRYEKRYRFPEVCVIGSGPAGLAATKGALDEGERVLLIEEQANLGGRSQYTFVNVDGCMDESLNGLTENEAGQKIIASFEKNENLEIMTLTQVFAIYEDNLVTAYSGNDLFKIRAEKVIVTTGATDRHLVFENNDKPGIMTGRGVERLIAMNSIRPADQAVVVTTHNGGYHSAKLLHGSGTKVMAVVDGRSIVPSSKEVEEIKSLGIKVIENQTIHKASGSKNVTKVTIGSIDGKQSGETINCDLVVVAVGYKTQLSLLAMGRHKPAWDKEREVLRISKDTPNMYAVGDINGYASFGHHYNEGFATGQRAANGEAPIKGSRKAEDNIFALPADIECGGDNHFICTCLDVTRNEAIGSIAEGFDQVETLKRYSSMGMGPCQGKTCHEAVARLTAKDTGLGIDEAAPTTYRPPYNGVKFGLFAGRAPHLGPIKRTAMHFWHEENGAQFLNAGQWKRPHNYGDPNTEALNVRSGLGLIDVSTLGKIELSGPDILDFIHFMFPGKFAKLAVGRVRYSTMIKEDGIIFEDGTLAHVEDGVYYLSTTTGNQDAIEELFRWWILTDNYDAHIRNLSAVNVAVNIAGEKVRDFMNVLVDIDMSNEAFPYMSCRKAKIEGVDVSLFRIGFTGEHSYEVHYPSEYGEAMWKHIMVKGEKYQLKPFGVEAQRILRLEKGHLLPGVDTDALSNPFEAGVGFTIKDDKENFVGKSFLKNFKDRGIQDKLVSYKLAKGAQIPDDGVAVLNSGEIAGRVSSSRYAPAFGFGVGLAWVTKELSEAGTEIQIRCADGGDVTGEVLDHCLYDSEGIKLKA